MKVSVYDKQGKKVKDLDIKSAVLDTEPKPLVLREVVLSFLAGQRNAHAKTKKRGEVSGGGKKPWRQKGTGRARTGSIRNPIWIGGGNIFGPTGIENFNKKVNVKVKKQSLFMALSSKKSVNGIIVLDKIDLKAPKTKEVANIFKKLPVEGKKLVVLPENSEILSKSLKNLEDTKAISFKSLNTYEVLRARQVVFIGDALEKTVEYFGSKEKKKAEPKQKETKPSTSPKAKE
ncbi:50S ribosomal protein L4 [bacterium (Candidatus Howlettbacteria) CG_4_10_14_0_8_um_filter_40_9]|nr:MAG: 50S ribosomal protein L4 [bacterium (Candidatus Howlettbacteria) CG_4_10_14_0_8_um_filter_40_9]